MPVSSLLTEGCRRLDSVVPLRQGERHCYRCGGYGGHPIQFDQRYSQVNPDRCGSCRGTGKDLDTLHHDTYVNPEFA